MRSWSHTPWLDDPSQSTVETIVIGGGWRDGWDGFRLVTAELGTVASPVESLVPVSSSPSRRRISTKWRVIGASSQGPPGRRDRAHDFSSGRRSKGRLPDMRDAGPAGP